jgi:hypothetical protein
MTNLSRRLVRLETRAATIARPRVSVRIHLVDPEKGLTGVLLIESDKATEVPITAEDEERFRRSSSRRRDGIADGFQIGAAGAR